MVCSAQSRGAEGRPHGGCSSSQGVEGQLGVRDRVCTTGRWAWNGMPRAVGTALSYQSARSVWTVLSDIGIGLWLSLGAKNWT